MLETRALEVPGNVSYGISRVDVLFDQDIFVIAMEKLENVTHFDTVDDVSQWTIDDIKVAFLVTPCWQSSCDC